MKMFASSICFLLLSSGFLYAGGTEKEGEKQESNLPPSIFSNINNISISGFGDIQYASFGAKNASSVCDVGQLEIDIVTVLKNRITVSAAIAYNAHDQIFGVGEFIIDFQIWGIDEDHFKHTDLFEAAGIAIGQFDVPFGIDWHVYPSIERKLISCPVAVVNTHNGWNDFGVRFYLERADLNLVAFGVNGYEYQSITMPFYEKAKMALGGRLGIKPFENLEIGGSYAGFINESNTIKRYLTGADLQFKAGQLTFKNEYIRQQISNFDNLSGYGYYSEIQYDLNNFYISSRYGRFSNINEQFDSKERISLGGGLKVIEGCDVRVENQFNSSATFEGSIMQVVVGF